MLIYQYQYDQQQDYIGTHKYIFTQCIYAEVKLALHSVWECIIYNIQQLRKQCYG